MINELHQYIRDEQARRGLTQTNFVANKSTDMLDAADLNVLKTAINECLGRTWSNSYASGTLIKADHIIELHTALNAAEVACPCNCDYCTCQCNYCTCDCNYCTCNCNYKSDNRLKIDITYF